MDKTGSFFLPPPHSTVAGDVDALFNFIYFSSAILLALVTAAMVLFIVRYRRRGAATTTSGIAHNTALEITWTLIPTIVVFIIFAWGFKGFIRLHVAPANSMQVKVTGQKWFWSFDYPDGASSVNELLVPAGQPVKLLMSSKDVIHSFYVPTFRIKMDVLPNRYTIAWFEATDTGNFNLFCTEYCGTKHSEMIGKVRVVTERQYAEWLETQSGPGAGESLVDYGARLYSQKACITCHSSDGKAGTGPTFKGIFGHTVDLEGGQSVEVDENYIRESILEPKAKVVRGFQPVMPTYQGLLKDKQIDGLVEYIKSLK
ncbi:MAG: cytochrome c oxidase subunit II [candidate division Zixibacteria bacterium]|nr:cytochrome c oxidase subunit II [candidate division Zixibacteria bacterium]